MRIYPPRPDLRSGLWLLLILLAVTLLPWLGCALFHSKGEPREAIVAVSMLQSGDWILPVSNGDVIPYKPPLLAWCIALVSMLFGGEVTEYTSRLPSALALIGLLVWTYMFIARRTQNWVRGIAVALLTLTSFEVFRAGVACRVDMLLTFCMVGALYALYSWWEHGLRMGWQPFVAVLAMSGAMLTKGPVGVALPCAVMWIFMMLEGVGWWRSAWRLALLAVASMLLPAVWYVAAWQEGGKEFVDLALEENIGRLTGTMSYESHVNPWWYNVVTLISGWLPWTLLMVISLVPWRRTSPIKAIRRWPSRFSDLRRTNPVRLFALIAAMVIFVFYCLPKSKRSVYLLPMYPFVALFIADYIEWMIVRQRRALKVYGGVIAVVTLLAYVAFALLQAGVISPSAIAAKGGRHALENAMTIASFSAPASWWKWLVVSLSAIVAFCTLFSLRIRGSRPTVVMTMVTTLTLYWAFASTYQPAAVNPRSDRALALALTRLEPTGPIYSHIETPMLRFFTADFYLGDNVRPFELDNPQQGYVIVGERDAEEWVPMMRLTGYRMRKVGRMKVKSCDVRQPVIIYKFAKRTKVVPTEAST